MKNRINAMAIALIFSSCSTSTTSNKSSALQDPYIWLEDVHSQKAMDWVTPHNEKSQSALAHGALYRELLPELRKIMTSKDRIPYPTIRNGLYRNFWQDEEHVRGIMRVTTAEEFSKKRPAWQTILDIDALNKKENKSWVLGGSQSLAPDYNLALVELSDGGSDKKAVREFDFSTHDFVPGGFTLPESKHSIAWLDANTLLVGTDFGPGSLTQSGYPRILKIWKRGTPLSSAKTVFEGSVSDVSVGGFRDIRPESSNIYVERGIGFFEEENFLYNDGKLQKLPFPTTAIFEGDFHGFLLAKLRQEWKTSARTFSAGSLVSLPLSVIGSSDFEKSLELVYEPDSRSTLSSVAMSKSFVFLGVLKNVLGQILIASHEGSDWRMKPVPLPSDGQASITDIDPFTDTILVSFQNFTTPTTLYRIDCTSPSLSPELLKKLPAQYHSKNIIVEQREVPSRDGTSIPYFLIHKKGIKYDGTNPTLLYAYGGFEASQTPYYLGTLGKVWLERGGVYAIANIRGGGEFGPQWHEAALKAYRQRAYDDFIAVSEELIRKKVTRPEHLGIRGGSNGGLLVGVAFTERPDLYRAVICESALLDMLRYHKLPPGASWMAEYGNPEIAQEASFISKYSPYQNLKAGVKYPKVFFYTSTGDDRVQPGHTRKMVARMEELGNEVLLYENTEGGHGAAADIEQAIKKAAMEYSYLFQQLK